MRSEALYKLQQWNTRASGCLLCSLGKKFLSSFTREPALNELSPQEGRMRRFLFLVPIRLRLCQQVSTEELYLQEKSESWILGVDEGVDGTKSGADSAVSY